MAMSAPTGEPYDLYGIACLAGGARRVIDAALVALVQSGRVRLEATGELRTVDARRRHPVEAAVLDAVGAQARHSAQTVRWRAEADPRVTAVGERLIAAGLLVPRRLLRAPGRPAAPGLTAAGRRALRRLRTEPPPDRLAGDTDALQVALDGLGVLDGPELRAALAPSSRSRRPGRRAHWDGRADAAWSVPGGPHAPTGYSGPGEGGVGGGGGDNG
jgi:hypothetical protein